MARGTTKSPCVGLRVEIPAYTDMWMRGARFGTIARVRHCNGRYLGVSDPRGAGLFAVRMDHPSIKKLAWFIADECRYL